MTLFGLLFAAWFFEDLPMEIHCQERQEIDPEHNQYFYQQGFLHNILDNARCKLTWVPPPPVDAVYFYGLLKANG